jgi:serine/threonine-protein kinase
MTLLAASHLVPPEVADEVASAMVAAGLKEPTPLGAGGAGYVFVAEQEASGVRKAVKVLKGPYEEKWLRRFRREADVLSRLPKHPRVVAVDPPGAVELGPYWAFIMEYVEGISLREYLVNQGPLSEDQTVVLINAVAETLAFVHSKQIIHRDLHAGNVLLRGRSLAGVTLVDFGTARDYSIQDVSESDVYRTFRPIGSMSHCAPEKWLTPHEVGPESDLFSVGVLAFNALTREYPFWEDSYAKLYEAIRRGNRKKVRELRPEISEDLEALLERMLEESPLYRVPRAEKVVQACRQLLERPRGQISEVSG